MKGLFLVLLISNSIYCIGQEILPPPDPTIIAVDSILPDAYPVIGERGSEAEFPGGSQALLKYLRNEFDWDCVNLSDSLKESSKVYLSFTVEEDGSITDVVVDRGINQTIDKCCADFIEKMPKWVPATDRSGKPLTQRVRLPITICLN